MKDVGTEESKQPYSKPTLTKHKPLRDITRNGSQHLD